MDFNTILCGDLLVKMDIATMHHALEARSPLLSKELLEFAPLLSPRFKVRNSKTKYILRMLSNQYLPKDIINQPKRGFEIPLKHWVDYELSEIIIDYLNKPEIATNFIQPEFIKNLLKNKISIPSEKRAKMIWSLFSLEVWYKNVYKR